MRAGAGEPSWVRARRLADGDLFDEAVGEGLFPLLRDHARSVEAIDVAETVLSAARRCYPELVATKADVRSPGGSSGRSRSWNVLRPR